jgi:hypothetical protein
VDTGTGQHSVNDETVTLLYREAPYFSVNLQSKDVNRIVLKFALLSAIALPMYAGFIIPAIERGAGSGTVVDEVNVSAHFSSRRISLRVLQRRASLDLKFNNTSLFQMEQEYGGGVHTISSIMTSRLLSSRYRHHGCGEYAFVHRHFGFRRTGQSGD